MRSQYHIPSQTLARQALTIFEQYRSDTPTNQAQLAAIGVAESKFDILFAMGNELKNIDAQNGHPPRSSESCRNIMPPALRAIIAWRNNSIMPRINSAFKGDVRLRYFRPGHLRSFTAASIIREARLLVSALTMFNNDDRLLRCCIGVDEIEAGRALIADAERYAAQTADAEETHHDVAHRIRELEDRIHDILGDIERCVAILFARDTVSARRYRMNEIRRYIMLHYGKIDGDDVPLFEQTVFPYEASVA